MGREKAWSKMESPSWSHLVGQLLLESVQPPESVLELAAILLAGQTAHPTPWEGCIKPSRSTLSLCPRAANSGDCRESRAGQIRRTAPPASFQLLSGNGGALNTM